MVGSKICEELSTNTRSPARDNASCCGRGSIMYVLACVEVIRQVASDGQQMQENEACPELLGRSDDLQRSDGKQLG